LFYIFQVSKDILFYCLSTKETGLFSKSMFKCSPCKYHSQMVDFRNMIFTPIPTKENCDQVYFLRNTIVLYHNIYVLNFDECWNIIIIYWIFIGKISSRLLDKNICNQIIGNW